MTQRWLVAICLLVLVSGGGSIQTYASEAMTDILAFEFDGPVAGEGIADEPRFDAIACGTPLDGLHCPINIEAQGRYFQEILDACGGAVDCFYASLREERERYAAEAAEAAWLDPVGLGAASAQFAEVGMEIVGETVSSIGASKPLQMHHFATNKHQQYTAKMAEIANKYGLDLNEAWNMDRLPQRGRHARAYHEWILKEMNRIDRLAQGDRKVFLQEFEIRVKAEVRANPTMMYADYWR